MTAMAHDPVDRVLSALESNGYKVDRRTRRAQCAGHHGQDLNLTVNPGDNGRALLTCQSHGCAYGDIMAAIGLSESDGFPDALNRNGSTPPRAPKQASGATIAATYD